MAVQQQQAAAGEVDGALRELAASGFSALAPLVPGLAPLRNEAVPRVLGLQQRYARVPSSPLTTAFSGPLVIAAPLPEGHHVEVAVTFDIMQAPAAFAMPVMQKRPWETPFQVRMSWRAALPLQFSTRVAAFAVDEAAVTSMLSWQVPSTADAAKSLLEHQQERTVVLAQEKGNESGVHAAEATFTFSKLCFGQPSQMRPRWLVFAASLLGGGCVYSHFLLPTVVMSRMAEQFDKAKRVLWGGAEPVGEAPPVKMDYRQMRKYVARELDRVGISREPSEDDFRYLAARAGFVVGPDATVRASSASTEELASFKKWFGSHLKTLKHIRAHYERSDPQVVSGFGMTREQADALLAPHPRGTFLLRFGSQGGHMVLSVRSSGGGAGTTHYSLDMDMVQRNGLEALLERNGKADVLLDATTGLLHSRTAVLDRSYLQAVNAAEARKRLKHRDEGGQEGQVESPPPPAMLQGVKPELGGGSGDEAMPAVSLGRSMSMGTQAAADTRAAVTRSLSLASQQCSQQALGTSHQLQHLQHMQAAYAAAQQASAQQAAAQQAAMQAQQQAQQQAAQRAAMQLDVPACYWGGGAMPGGAANSLPLELPPPFLQPAAPGLSVFQQAPAALPMSMLGGSASMPLPLPAHSLQGAGSSPWAPAASGAMQPGSHTVGAPPLLRPSSADAPLRWGSRGLSPAAGPEGLGPAHAPARQQQQQQQQSWPPAGQLAAAVAAQDALQSPTSSGTASFPGSTGTGSSGAGAKCLGPAGGHEQAADLLHVSGLTLAPGCASAAAWPAAYHGHQTAAAAAAIAAAGVAPAPPVLPGMLPEQRVTAGTALRQLGLGADLDSASGPHGDLQDLLAKLGTTGPDGADLDAFI